MAEQCAAYRPGFICANGFVQKAICRRGDEVGCHACGHISDAAIPNCLRDELPNHWIKEDGSPAFYIQEPRP